VMPPPSRLSRSGVDIVSALEETRQTAAEGISKRGNAVVGIPSITLSSISSVASKRRCIDSPEPTSSGVTSTPVSGIRSTFDSLFQQGKR
jgi:hypothetical protein